MDPTPDPRRRRVLIVAIAASAALLVLVGIGIYGLLRGPNSPDPAATTSPTPGASSSPLPEVPGATRGTAPSPIPELGTPEQFARAVAAALFTWDTSTGFLPVDYAQPLADVGHDVEADAFASDVRSYLPTAQAWAQLRGYQTRQWLSIDTIAVPESWQTALDQAAPGQIPPGTIAYTVDGIRHRAGIWGTEPTEAQRPVSFTIFITCTSPIPERPLAALCQVLRLSALDVPLR